MPTYRRKKPPISKKTAEITEKYHIIYLNFWSVSPITLHQEKPIGEETHARP
ncbi:MAG: hypothetical protein ACI9BD_000156 [Candidatus Marinamargulisbacteria bacterium]|jgi:hypothetical protein